MSDRLPPLNSDDWYVYVYHGEYFVVDTLHGIPVRSDRATARDIAQATMRGKIK